MSANFEVRNTSRDVVEYDIAWKSGSTGAVPAIGNADMHRARGIESITRDSAGTFTVVFTRSAEDVSKFSGFVEQASFALTGACRCVFVSQDLTGAKSVTFKTISETKGSGDSVPTVVDPAAGDIVHVTIGLKHSRGVA